MKNEALLKRAFDAAFQVGELVCEMNNRTEWTEEEIDAAATELRRRLLGEDKDA